VKVRLEWKPEDCWVGVFWRRGEWANNRKSKTEWRTDVWICLLPMLPIHLWWIRPMKEGE
jgi:hypothetical protein